MEIRDQGVDEPFLLSRRLPQLVVDLLLGYIGIDTLKTLRLVCKTSKSLVESPELIHQFVVRVTGDARLDDVLGATDPVPWTSFLLASRHGNHFTSAGIQRFLAAYGDLVYHLELESGWGLEEQVVDLLSGCPHLESLRIYEMGFNYISDDNLSKQLLENWRNLRHFHVLEFLKDDKPIRRMTFFFRLLFTSTKLETLTVPSFNLSSISFVPDSFQQLVLTPLLETIAEGRLRSITVSNEDFNDELLLQLAIACRKKGTALHTKFKNSKMLEDLPPEHLPVLDIIANLYGITDTIIRQSLTNVRRIRVTSSGFNIKNDAYTMPPFPYLTDLEFNFLCFEDVKSWQRLELFVGRLARVRRPTVKSLCVQYAANPPMTSLCASPVYLCTNFMNLRVLRLRSWHNKDDECLKLWPLVGRTLVELEISYCRTLRDRGILGDDLSQPAFLQLKHLRKLTLQNRDWESQDKIVTELSFLYAFRHMRLRSFDFLQSRRFKRPRNFSATTVKAMWDGVFGEDIQRYFLQGKNMMRTQPRAKGKPLRYQEMNLDEDGHIKFVCCSIS